jgi:hypothetical protein
MDVLILVGVAVPVPPVADGNHNKVESGNTAPVMESVTTKGTKVVPWQ